MKVNVPSVENLIFTSQISEQAVQDEKYVDEATHFIDISGFLGPQDFLHIAVFHEFCENMRSSIEAHPDTLIVVCPKDHTESSQNPGNFCS